MSYEKINSSISDSTIDRIIETIVIIEFAIAFISIGRVLSSDETIVTEILTLKNRELSVFIDNVIYAFYGITAAFFIFL